MDHAALRDLLGRQNGTVARRQLLGELDLASHDVDRLRRRRELVRTHAGVYVDHTGPLTWSQRAWVAVHAVWPAALGHHSALPRQFAERVPVIHVLVDRKRTVRAPVGVRVHRTGHLADHVQWHRSPPRQRLEDATLDVVLSLTSVAARFQVLAEVLQTRRTTAARLQEALAARPRVRDRRQLVDLLADLASGAHSVLEREYLRLERVHGLPVADRQQPGELVAGRVYRDAPYPAFGVTAELDGRAFHDNARARDRDLERDLDTQVEDGSITVRLGYGQVFDRGCATIAKVGGLLVRRGWAGPVLRCQACQGR